MSIAFGASGIAIGANSNAPDSFTISIGDHAVALGHESVSVGHLAGISRTPATRATPHSAARPGSPLPALSIPPTAIPLASR
jgi:hypothetical protein